MIYESFAYSIYRRVLINKYSNPTEEFVDELFDNY